MSLKIYNTLTRTKETFVPLDPKNVRMYVCGPTVYDFAHIGNARPAIVFDVLFRLLRHLYGENHVTYVRNITDVDDKINARALRDHPGMELNAAIRLVTETTANQYFSDVRSLGCLDPTEQPRATEHIEGMVDMISVLINKGHAYVAAGEVLFAVDAMADYGKLSGRKLEDQQAGARVAVEAHKKNPADFVLWKLSSAEEPGWESPWGRGRPGWHIECSVMSKSLLGETFDIHGGGLDLIFPHHENEIAQSRCAHGTQVMANYWMHNGFLQVEGQKMSKSLGNFRTIRNQTKLWPGCTLRLNMLGTHYTQPIDWTDNLLEECDTFLCLASSAIKFHNITQSNLPEPDPIVLQALLDDLNTPLAISVLKQKAEDAKASADIAAQLYSTLEFLGVMRFEALDYYCPLFVTDENFDILYSEGSISAADKTARLFRAGVLNGDAETEAQARGEIRKLGFEICISQDENNISLLHLSPIEAVYKEEISRQISARVEARKAKNWIESDRIRDELAAMGIAIKDNKDGTTTWEVKR